MSNFSQFVGLKPEDSPAVNADFGMPMLGMRSDSDISTVSNDGDYTILKLDEAGRLKVSVQPASYPDSAGNITANGQTIFANVDRASNVTISMVATSLVGHVATFEYSNNSTNGTDGNWYVVQVVRSNANTVETSTGTLTATPVYGWETSVNAYKWIRIRATGHTSGTAAYIIKQGTYATEPVPAMQVTGTQPVSGTVTANQGSLLAASSTTVNINSAASTNLTLIRNAVCSLYGISVSSIAASTVFVKLYNKATAPLSTDIPVLIIPVLTNTVQNLTFGTTGHRFALGLGIAITGAAADNDTTAVVASQVKLMIQYI